MNVSSSFFLNMPFRIVIFLLLLQIVPESPRWLTIQKRETEALTILHKIVDECPLTIEEQTISSPLLKQDYHYVVIDIKFSTLPLRADGKHLLNSDKYPAYKAQCLIYRDAVGLIQGYTSQYAFILGRRWKYTQKDVKHTNFTHTQ